MQTIKGLTVLLLVATVVFAIAAMNDIKSQAKYAAGLRNPATVNVAGNAIGKVANTTTNMADQARRKTPRT